MFERYNHDIIIAVEAILANKVRSLLTAMGIIFGVAAVISMLAIGNGAQQEIMEQIEQVGVNNIIVKPVVLENKSDKESGEVTESKGFSPGLSMQDVESIKVLLPSLKQISPVISTDNLASRKGQSMRIKLEGITPNYFDLFNLPLAAGGYFSDKQVEKGAPVCVIGENVRARLFRDVRPLGQEIKVGDIWLNVVGVIQPRDFTSSANDEMGISSSDNKVFIPAKTMLLRFEDRSKLDFEALQRLSLGDESGSEKSKANQLDKIVIQVAQTEQLSQSAELIRRLLLRRHKDNLDFEVTVPELLLKQQQQTNRIFNIVLGAIAGISLLVGGIGIMNIMLASVMERIREIGTRQAIGATRKDIVVQFLAEATLISVIGGLIGVFLGIALAMLITVFADIKTIITPFSVLVAFTVSSSVGIVFGFFPARKASLQDPVESIRH